MTEPKFTPAPWKFCKRYGFFDVWKGSGDDAIEIAAIRHIPNDHNHEEEEANANLIAAAPLLYDSLECLLNEFKAKKEQGFQVRSADFVIEICSYALAKANGESND